ncbi:MAG: type II secretion system protein [Wolinella sp.]
MRLLKRRGFSMIELVFAIVIIGITILTIPLFIEQTHAHLQRTDDSKGYYHALALMQIARIKPWDRANINDFEASNLYYVLDTTEAGYECNHDADGFRKRPGMVATSHKERRLCDPSAQRADPIAGDSLTSLNFKSYSEPPVEGKYNLSIEAKYVDSTTLAPVAGVNITTNTKHLQVTMSKNREEIARYHYYATNIGTDTPITKRLRD